MNDHRYHHSPKESYPWRKRILHISSIGSHLDKETRLIKVGDFDCDFHRFRSHGTFERPELTVIYLKYASKWFKQNDIESC